MLSDILSITTIDLIGVKKGGQFLEKTQFSHSLYGHLDVERFIPDKV